MYEGCWIQDRLWKLCERLVIMHLLLLLLHRFLHIYPREEYSLLMILLVFIKAVVRIHVTHQYHHPSSPSRNQVGISNRPPRRRPVGQSPALATRPLLLIGAKVLDSLLDLRAQVRAVKGRLVHDDGLLARREAAVARGAVPAHAVDGVWRPALLQHDADGVCEAHGVVRRVGGQQEHVALADDDVAEG